MTEKKDRPNCPKCGKQMTRGPKAQSGKLRWECKKADGAGKQVYCCTTTNPDKPFATDRKGSAHGGKTPIFKRTLGPVQRFIITAAQNATPVHAPFLKSLEVAANHMNAELLVIPQRYKNPTSRWSASQSNDEIWSPSLVPYLWNQRRSLNKNLTLLADIKTQPTASEPLMGFDSMSGPASAIIGHTKMALKTIPTPQNRMAKILTTTGACTIANYTDSKAGKLGEFHHTLGALVVEIQGSKFHLRQLNADKQTGEFTDLKTRYTLDGAKLAPRPLALVMGDTHVDFIDPAVERATFGPKGIIELLRPEALVFHDLVDAYSVNPHHNGNPFNQLAKIKTGMNDVRKEVARAAAFVLNRTPSWAQSLIVSSNHDDFLRRWVIDTDWRSDPANAAFYLETALAMVSGTKMTGAGTVYPSPFIYWMGKLLKQRANIRCIGGESVVLGGVELSMHGDRGPSGTRGSAKNLRRIGVKSIIGHSHSPEINEGCYQVGTSTRLRLEYNSGPSSWLNTHCVLHADGKRQLINIIDGDWHL